MVSAYGAKVGAENFARNWGRGLLGDNSTRMEMTFGDIEGVRRTSASIEALKAEGSAQAVKILDRSIQNTRTSELAESFFDRSLTADRPAELAASLAYKANHALHRPWAEFRNEEIHYNELARRASDLAARQGDTGKGYGALAQRAIDLGQRQRRDVKALTAEFGTQAPARKTSIAGLEQAKARYEAGSPISRRSLLTTPTTIGGYRWWAAKSNMEEAVLRNDLTAGGHVSDAYGVEVSNQMANMRADLTHGSQNVTASDPAWAPKWSIIGNEARSSHTGMRMLTEQESMAAPARTPEVVVKSFLDDAEAQKEYLKISGETRVTTDGMRDWLGVVYNRMTALAPNAQARDILLSGKTITPEMAGAIKGADRFPIYGPDILRTDESLGKEALDKFYNLALNMPDMHLARVPMFNGLYHANIRELLPAYVEKAKAAGRTDLTDREMFEVSSHAKRRALNDVRRDMYDVDRQVGAHGVTTIISPFFRAWEDAMVSWGRLMYDDPARIGELLRLSQTPDMFGMTTKQDGTPVMPFDGTALQDKYVTIPLFGLGGLKGFRANLGSFNSIQQGNVPFSPGVGPTVQLSATLLVADVLPDLGEPGQALWAALAKSPDNILIKSVFPSAGLPKADPMSLALSVLPAWGRKLIDATLSNDDRSFGSIYTSAFQVRYNDLIIQYRTANGGRDPAAKELLSMKETAKDGAKAAGIASAASAFALGVSGNAAPEGQLYMDKMHALNQMAPALAAQGLTPAGVFATAYPNAARLNWSLSVNEGRLEATVNATSAYQKYRTLMDNNKESSWWIAGADDILGNLNDPDTAGTSFSQSAYNQQLNRGLRRRYTTGELADQAQISMGYGRMGEFDAALDLYMRQNGIKSLNSKAAGQLGQMKTEYRADLRAQFPAWAVAFDTSDKGKRDRQLTQITAMVTDPPPGLRARPDVVTTSKYLFARKALATFAAEQGVTNWQTNKNFVDDRYTLWKYGKTLAAGDIVFQRGWSRLFESEFSADLAPQVGN